MITAVVPTSPIAAHPDTSILEETLDTIRGHLPGCEVIVTFDGVRAEQENLRGAYEEYIRRALWICDKGFGNVCPLIFDDHQHQTGMMRAALKEVRTPLVLYVEHDTPLTPDCPIPFDTISKFIQSGASNLVRFHHEAHIPAPHRHLMHGRDGVIYTKTTQWSQRPHVASADYYRWVMDTYFSAESRSFIEDRMHGAVQDDGWDKHKLHIYTPDGNIKRSYHLDGRAGGPKWEAEQVF